MIFGVRFGSGCTSWNSVHRKRACVTDAQKDLTASMTMPTPAVAGLGADDPGINPFWQKDSPAKAGAGLSSYGIFQRHGQGAIHDR